MYTPKYFSLSELIRSDTAKQKGIDNIPTFTVVKNLSELCRLILDPVRTEYGLSIHVNSGFRCVTLNSAVGGVSNSQHLSGCAVDLTCSNMEKLFTLLSANKNVDQLLFEHSKTSVWLHVSFSPVGKPRNYIVHNHKA